MPLLALLGEQDGDLLLEGEQLVDDLKFLNLQCAELELDFPGFLCNYMSELSVLSYPLVE